MLENGVSERLSKMLPTHRCDKWGVNNMSKVLALALLLLLSVQILTWRGRPLVQLPCPFPQVGHADDHPVSASSPSVTPTQVDNLPVLLTKDPLPPNSYFPDADSDIWHCKQHYVDELNMTYTDWVTGNFTDEQALCAAHRHAKRPMATGTPRIAFLFLTRGAIAVEPLWRMFFSGHEDKYSLYVHATDKGFKFGPDSLFHNRTIPSKRVVKVHISLPEAMRRLLAYALLDATAPNAWFHVLCDSSIPIRGFPYAYDYITNSQHSFVESFYPTSNWWRTRWNTTGDMAVPEHLMRKGEAWITVHRRHGGLIVGDHYLFPRFKHHWFKWGIPSEVYIPTLFAILDPQSVANHSLVYVNWVETERGASSPVLYNRTSVYPSFIQEIQNLTANVHGFYTIDKKWNDETEKSCVYNGAANSRCFLFARKFAGEASDIANLMRLSPLLGYR